MAKKFLILKINGLFYVYEYVNNNITLVVTWESLQACYTTILFESNLDKKRFSILQKFIVK